MNHLSELQGKILRHRQNSTAIEAGLRVVNTTISSNFVRPDEANKAQSMVKDKGKHSLIDKVKVR